MTAEKTQRSSVSPEIKLLEDIGLRQFTPNEIHAAHAQLAQAFEVGITRSGLPTTEDGGIPAVKTGVEPITADAYDRVPDGRVLGGSYGGTSWYTGIIAKEGPITNVEIINNGATPHSRVDTRESFVERIGNHVLGGAVDRDISDIRAVGASCGFEQTNSHHTRGIDAQIHVQPSNWKITDLDTSLTPEQQPYLGEELLRYLSYQGAPQIKEVYFQNDTNAVVHDVATNASDVVLPLGFVFGTGSNAALRDINTQASSVNLFGKDAVYQEMVDLGYVPAKPQMKLWMGGERIAYRVAAGMKLLAKEGLVRDTTADEVARMIRENGKGLIISNILNGQLSYDALLQEGIPLTFSEYQLLKQSSQASLNQAGQAIGVMMATAIEATGHTSGKAKVPVEGSVFWKAHGVRDVAQETVKLLLPEVDLLPYEASGLQGIGKLALTYSHAKMSTPEETVFQQ